MRIGKPLTPWIPENTIRLDSSADVQLVESYAGPLKGVPGRRERVSRG
jgi:hypothetical protein